MRQVGHSVYGLLAAAGIDSLALTQKTMLSFPVSSLSPSQVSRSQLWAILFMVLVALPGCRIADRRRLRWSQ